MPPKSFTDIFLDFERDEKVGVKNIYIFVSIFLSSMPHENHMEKRGRDLHLHSSECF